MKAFIYGLRDPRTKEIRYIGKTQYLHARHLTHERNASANNNPHSHKENWLRELRSAGLVSEVVVLEEVELEKWEAAERSWISYGRAQGWPLTNMTDGGDGGALNSEARERANAKLKGRSTWAKGRHQSEASKLKNRLAHLGKHHTPEARAKIRAARLGKKRNK